MRLLWFMAYLFAELVVLFSPAIIALLVIRMLAKANEWKRDDLCFLCGGVGCAAFAVLLETPADLHEFLLRSCARWWIFWPTWGLILGCTLGLWVSIEGAAGIDLEPGRNRDRLALIALVLAAYVYLHDAFDWGFTITLAISVLMAISAFGLLYFGVLVRWVPLRPSP